MEQVFSHANRSKLQRNIKIGIGLFAVFKAVTSALMYYESKWEVAYRKEQLAKPVYELKDDQLITPPWNNSNIRDWLYRRVKVTGRPMHYRTCMVPRQVYNRPGFEYVVPLVTKESKAGVTQYGYIFSKGFIPAQYQNPNNRARIEETDPQTFQGFVSRLSELSNHGFFAGNATALEKLGFTHANMKDFVEASGLKNVEQAKVAMIERLGEGSPLDERNPVRYAHDAEYKFEYPYPKTLSGALQMEKMPWNHRSDSVFWSTVGLAAFGSLLI